MKVLDFIDNFKLNQIKYLDLLHELDVCKSKALIKLKNEDPAVKSFVNSKLYVVLKSNLIENDKKYEYYLKTVDDYTKCITKEVFDILMRD